MLRIRVLGVVTLIVKLTNVFPLDGEVDTA